MKPLQDRRYRLWTTAVLPAVIVAGLLAYFAMSPPSSEKSVTHENGPPAPDSGETATTPQDAAGQTVMPPPTPPQDTQLAAQNRTNATRIMDVSNLPEFAGLEPRRITVDFNDQTLASAVQEFAMQSGSLTDALLGRPQALPNPALTPVVPADHRITMHMHEGTLLQGVLEMVNEGADIGQLNASSVRLNSSRDHDWGTGRLCIAGPFAVVLEKVQTGVPQTPGGAMLAPNEARMPMMLYADPTVNMLEVRMPPVFEELVDENGQKPVATWVSGTASVPASVRPDINRATADLKLTWPQTPGSRLKMRGKIGVTIQRQSETITSQSVMEWPVTQQAGALSVVFHDFEPMKPFQSTATLSIEIYELHLEFKRGNIDPEQWKQMADVLPTREPIVLDARGKPLTCYAGMKSLSENPSESIMVRYRVSADTQHRVPDHVQLEVVQGVQQIGVPFAYEDVPVEAVAK